MSREAIDQTNTHFVTNFNKGDVAAAAGVYTQDAIVLPPGRPSVAGRDAIREFWVAAAQQLGVTGVTLQTSELQLAGDTAFEVGSYTLSGREGLLDEGKYIVVWRRQPDGAWKWHRDIWNSNRS